MHIHLIAIGGSVMHNLALALQLSGHQVTGSDDEIYNPSRGRLARAGLLPDPMGWHPERIHEGLDLVILGMHARKENPELLKAQELQLPVLSFPEFIYQQSKDKKRVVVAGSHGKTSTTSMIMHVLKANAVDFDYLVGAQIANFELMVRLSDAPIIILEGDEYLSSPIDRRPKIFHYKPDISILTGIEWDHINVFPTFENYKAQFATYVSMLEPGSSLIYFEPDKHVQDVAQAAQAGVEQVPYQGFEAVVSDTSYQLKTDRGALIPLQVFGQHNLANMRAAFEVCKRIGIAEEDFWKAITSFGGSAKRLQQLYHSPAFSAYLDFAHAPSKVRATVNAVKERYPNKRLVACLELHTFSSLNKSFLHQYQNTMAAADWAAVYYSTHTLSMKKLPPITPEEVQQAFGQSDLVVYQDAAILEKDLKEQDWSDAVLLLMSSGTFSGMKFQDLVHEIAPST